MGNDAHERARADESPRIRPVEPRPAEQADEVTRLADPASNSAPRETMAPRAVLNLQRRAGNAAVASMLRPVASRRASTISQTRAKTTATGTKGKDSRVLHAQRAFTPNASSKGSEDEKEDVDTSEFTPDPKAAAAKLAQMPPPSRVVPPQPEVPVPKAAKPPVRPKATKKVAMPDKKAPPAKKGSGKPVKAAAPGEVVKKPPPPLPPAYKYEPGAEVKWPPPERPAPKEPRQDPAFVKVTMAAKKTVKSAKKHPKGADERDSAMAAAQSPPNEKQATAEVVRAGEMQEKAKPKAFDEGAFIEAVMTQVEKAKPKNLEEGDEVDSKAANLKGEISKEVGTSKEQAAGPVTQEAKKPTDLSKGEDRKDVPMKPLEIAQPGGMKASAGMPAPVPNDQIDMRAGPAQVDKEMADAEITDEQLAQSNEPEFLNALDAKKEGEKNAKDAPAQIRKAEGEILKQAASEAAAAEKATVGGAQGSITAKKAAIEASKKSTISKDEAERKKVSDGINKIFDKTKTDVNNILTNLDTTVDDMFTKGEKAIREAFTHDWETRLANYKDERYSGFWGWKRWLRDKFAGLPAKAKDLFKKSQAMYESMMRKLVKRIAGTVSAELTKATNRIKEGREEVATYVSSLKGAQAKFGAEAAKDIGDKFDQLDSDVKDKFDEMATTIAGKYSESRDAVNAEIEAAWEKEKGLIDKAIDAVKGVYNALKNLKDMLVRIFYKIIDVIGQIIAHPIRFIQNFFKAVKDGISLFMNNIGEHLKAGIMGWLTGNLGAKGIEIPESFDLPGMGKLVLSVFGLSWNFIKERITNKITPAGMEALEKGAGIVQKLQAGPAALWEMVSEKFTDFQEMVLDKIKDYLENKIVVAGITFLISMLNPASAFIKACKMIYDVVMFIIDRGKEIGEFIEAIVDAAGDIARGGGGGVPKKIESVLAKALPLAIGFCASLLSLGGVGKKVQEIIDKVRKPIFKAVDKVIDTILRMTAPIWKPAKRLFERGKAAYAKGKEKVKETYEAGKAKAKDLYGKGKAKVSAGAAAAKGKVVGLFKKQQKGLSMSGAQHTLTAAARKDGKVAISMASTEGLLSTKIGEAITSLKETASATTDAKHRDLIEAQIKQLKDIAAIAADLEKKAAAAGQQQVLATGAPPGFADAMNALAGKIESYGNKYKVTDITKATTESVVVDIRLLTKFGLPMPSYLQAQKVADKFNAAIDIRPTNITAGKIYETGANPKSEAFKEKTLNEDDVLLGAPASHIGKVAWFLPSRPNKSATEQLMKEKREDVVRKWWKRWRQRKDEYYEYEPKMKKKLKEGEILIHEKLTGAPSGGIVLSGLNGLPYTGDHDIYEVHGDAKSVIQALKAPPFNVQHGAHVDWPNLPAVVEKGGLDAAETQIFNSIVAQHAPGGKALLRINPKGPPTAVSSKTPRSAKPTKGAGGGGAAGAGPEIDGTVVKAGPGGFAGLVAAEEKLKAEAAAAAGGVEPITTPVRMAGGDHTLIHTPGTTPKLEMASVREDLLARLKRERSTFDKHTPQGQRDELKDLISEAEAVLAIPAPKVKGESAVRIQKAIAALATWIERYVKKWHKPDLGVPAGGGRTDDMYNREIDAELRRLQRLLSEEWEKVEGMPTSRKQRIMVSKLKRMVMGVLKTPKEHLDARREKLNTLRREVVFYNDRFAMDLQPNPPVGAKGAVGTIGVHHHQPRGRGKRKEESEHPTPGGGLREMSREDPKAKARYDAMAYERSVTIVWSILAADLKTHQLTNHDNSVTKRMKDPGSKVRAMTIQEYKRNRLRKAMEARDKSTDPRDKVITNRMLNTAFEAQFHKLFELWRAEEIPEHVKDDITDIDIKKARR